MNIKIVVPISGGKDSQACLKLALESHSASEVRGLFCDTGWEHPMTYAHIDKMRGLYGVRIDRISAGTVEQEVIKAKTFPASVVRFCTDRLKIVPSKKYYSALADSQGGFEVWAGMRTGESKKRAERYAEKLDNELYAPHELNKSYPKYLAAKGVRFRLPILEWSSGDVYEYLGGTENPMYSHGFDRVGCFPCLASTKRKHQQAFDFDLFGASQKHRVIMLEQAIGKKHAPADTDQLCMFCHI